LWAFSKLARQSFFLSANKFGAIKLGFLAVDVTFGMVSAKYVNYLGEVSRGVSAFVSRPNTACTGRVATQPLRRLLLANILSVWWVGSRQPAGNASRWAFVLGQKIMVLSFG
jgi:hypothetical protein